MKKRDYKTLKLIVSGLSQFLDVIDFFKFRTDDSLSMALVGLWEMLAGIAVFIVFFLSGGLFIIAVSLYLFLEGFLFCFVAVHELFFNECAEQHM